MYKVERSALVMHSAEKMFTLVNDIDGYQEFLPWCGGSRVLSSNENVVIASVDIAFKGVKKTFTTRNDLDPYQRTEMTLVDGPFSSLAGFWLFSEISPEASRISLQLSFDFSNPLVAAVVGPVYRIIANSMLDSFCQRADQLYGNSSGND